MKTTLSIEEASKACSIGRTKLYAAINSGALKAKKLGRRTIILKEDLDTFLFSLEPYSIPQSKT